MDPQSFFHVAIKVNDIDESMNFYKEHFDATLLERGSADNGSGPTAVYHVALEVADKRVYLFDRAPYEAAGYVENIPVGFLHYGFVVDDVEKAYRALAADRVEFLMSPATFGNLKIAFFLDPAGVRVELIEHLE